MYPCFEEANRKGYFCLLVPSSYQSELNWQFFWKGIELNTGGLYKGANHPNPHPAIIKRYRELGGEIITLGSDDHEAKYLGYAFDQAQDLLKDCGFKYYCTFKDRKAEFHKF